MIPEAPTMITSHALRAEPGRCQGQRGFPHDSAQYALQRNRCSSWVVIFGAVDIKDTEGWYIWWFSGALRSNWKLGSISSATGIRTWPKNPKLNSVVKKGEWETNQWIIYPKRNGWWRSMVWSFRGKEVDVLNWESGLQISSPWEQGQAAWRDSHGTAVLERSNCWKCSAHSVERFSAPGLKQTGIFWLTNGWGNHSSETCIS